MHPFRTFLILVIFAGLLLPGSAQKPTTPVNINALFADLPIDDAAGNSVLSKGENGEEKIKKNIFVIGILNKSVCYTGEPILLTYRLYSALQSKSLIASRPVLNNFNAEERPLNNENPDKKEKEGKMYRVFTIWQVQMIPFQPGKLIIDPLVVNNEVSYTSDNKTYSYSGMVSSDQPVLTVLPLPEYHGPGGFSGAIGKFQMKAFVVSARMAADETDSLRMEIEGSGNLDDITIPTIKWPAGFEYFSAKGKWELRKNAFPPAGKKVVTIPFVARKEGYFTIPSIRFPYFDPSLKAYRELQSGPIVMDILPALAGNKKRLPLNPPAPVPSREYTWILWFLAFLGISGLVLKLLRKRAQMLPSTSSGTSSGSHSGVSPGDAPDRDASDRDAPDRDASDRDAADRDALLAANAKKDLEGLMGPSDKEQYIIGVKAVLSRFLQKKFQTAELSGDGLADTVYWNTQDHALAERIREVYSRCSRLLYSPSDLTGADSPLGRTNDSPGTDSPLAAADVSLAGAASLIIERCETYKNINRLP